MTAIKRNLGLVDRSIRLVFALALITAVFSGTFSPVWNIFLAVIAAVELLSASTGY